MKTAEEWLKERLEGKHGEPVVYTMEEWNKIHIDLYKKIQLDAWKQGIQEAINLIEMADIAAVTEELQELKNRDPFPYKLNR